MLRRRSSPTRRRSRLALAAAGIIATAVPLATAGSVSATGPQGYHEWYSDGIFTYLFWCSTLGDPLITPTTGCVVVLDWWEVEMLAQSMT